MAAWRQTTNALLLFTLLTSPDLGAPGAVALTVLFVCRVSRSETSGTSRSSGVPFVSEYLKEELLCEGSELCFEEVRAAKYFRQEANRAQAGLNREVEAEAVEQPCAPVPTSVLAPTQQVLPQEPQVSQ